MFHSGLSVFSSSDINQIVSIFSNAAFPRPWKNNMFINCTYLSVTKISGFQIFSIQLLNVLKLLCLVRKWKTGWLMVSEQNTPHLRQNKAEHCFNDSRLCQGTWYVLLKSSPTTGWDLSLPFLCFPLSSLYFSCSSQLRNGSGSFSLPYFNYSLTLLPLQKNFWFGETFTPFKQTSGFSEQSLLWHHFGALQTQQNTFHEIISSCIQGTPGKIRVLNFERMFVYLM